MADQNLPELPKNFLETINLQMEEAERSLGAVVILKANFASTLLSQVSIIGEVRRLLEPIFGQNDPILLYLALVSERLLEQLVTMTGQELTFQEILTSFEQLSTNWSRILQRFERLQFPPEA